MAQAATTGLIHGAVAANPPSGSQQIRVDKLRPIHGFEAKVLGRTEKKSRQGVSARRFVRSELQVIPVSVCYLRMVVLLEQILVSSFMNVVTVGKNVVERFEYPHVAVRGFLFHFYSLPP